MIYLIGHGVEHDNRTFVVLKEGNRRVKYDLEKIVYKIARTRLVHVMFDCSRVYFNDVRPKSPK